MAAVEQLYVAPKSESPALKRIRRLSLLFAAFAILVAFIYLATLAAAFFYTGEDFRLTTDGPTLYLGNDAFAEGSVKISDVPLASRLIGFAPLTIIQGALIAAFYCLYKLFAAYRAGIVFAEMPVRWMRRAGGALALFAIAPGLLQPLVQAAGLMDRNWLQPQMVAALLVGGALFVLASVITLGRELEEEGEGYI
jgi:hypothetical protein